ncbi:zinc-binding alcohol dehydrogenase family protein [Spongisporangium articulatum]|uniref:Zinc-binding alcohol dehydrogenase family protein n=1 Tax=Spongisporangium articulatum TaxID=3362603 RepID=A0ABW8AT20_9ACTN
MRAVQIVEFGGPEVMRVTDVEDPVAQPGQLLIEVSAAGINYADTHQTENSYLAAQKLPMIPGAEAVGRISGGERDGERVVALLGAGGGYAEKALTVPQLAFPVPDEVDDASALALIVQGTTAWHLLRTCSRMQVGESVVVHAAAGGVGTLAVQLAKAWGAGRVIGVASGEEKAKLATELGADVTVDLSGTTSAAEVKASLREANGGKPVDIVLEMTGGHVFDGSLAALGALGRLITFGMASRVPPSPVEVGRLMARSQTVAGFWLIHALTLPGGLAQPMEELASMVRAGRLRAVTGGTYSLDQAADAHRALLSRSTVGKLILTP